MTHSYTTEGRRATPQKEKRKRRKRRGTIVAALLPFPAPFFPHRVLASWIDRRSWAPVQGGKGKREERGDARRCRAKKRKREERESEGVKKKKCGRNSTEHTTARERRRRTTTQDEKVVKGL
jgi:hypothetical protein